MIAPHVLPHDNQLAADIASDSEAEDTQHGDGASGSEISGNDGGEDYDSDNDSDPNLDSGDDALGMKAKGKGGRNNALKPAAKSEDEDEV